MPKSTITIDVDRRGARLDDLFGIFFEDLNHAADGGLYAELVQNRSFEFDPIDNSAYHSLTAWEKIERGDGKVGLSVLSERPLNENNKHYLSMEIECGDGGAGVQNLGFNEGIPLKSGEKYLFSCYAKSGDIKTFTAALESIDGKAYDSITFDIGGDDWQKYEAQFAASDTDFASRLVITASEKGTLCIDMVSLFPKNTFNGRENGLRNDIAQLLYELKPKFMRFPGGCLVHEGALDADARDSMYRWKNTLGDVAHRPSRRNNWNYNQTFGLGYYEYFQFCEDIGAKAVPVLPAGYNPHNGHAAPLSQMREWIDDALDLIEFANGGQDTAWGAKRAQLGHPEPFGLEYLAIGNEETGEAFFERYNLFHDAIRNKYPDIKIINTGGPFAIGEWYERGWRSAREKGSDLVDEHYYTSPEWLLANYHRYEEFDSEGPKAFVGEYATWGNTFYNALAEAAYMTGLERSAHAVGLACYAPMLCNVGYENWRTNLIWFDGYRVCGTPNYYAQKLFMHNQGNILLQSTSEGLEPDSDKNWQKPIKGMISLVGNDSSAMLYDIKINDAVNKKEIAPDDINVVETDGPKALCEEEFTEFTLTCKAKRTDGEKGFVINFGWDGKETMIEWRFGGWGNHGIVMHAVINGRGTCISSNSFEVETGREYDLRLEVSGRHMRAYVDGALLNEAEDTLPEIKPLYFSATKEDASGDIILKAVNVSEEATHAEVILSGTRCDKLKGVVFEMAGYKLDAENTLDNPRNVVPYEKSFEAQGNSFAYEFPEHSITVFKLKVV